MTLSKHTAFHAECYLKNSPRRHNLHVVLIHPVRVLHLPTLAIQRGSYAREMIPKTQCIHCMRYIELVEGKRDEIQ